MSIRKATIISVWILALLAAVCASCKGRLRERIRERREESNADIGQALGEDISPEQAFDYESGDLNAELTEFQPEGPLESQLLDDSYTLYYLQYQSEGDTAKALYAVPAEGEGPFPAVLLIHGHHSSKAYMIGRYAAELASRGIASLAIDLPLQGERKVEGEDYFPGDIRKTAETLKRSVIDARRALDWLETREEIDSGKMGVIGYSLGSWIATMAASADARLRAVALNVMGKGEPTAVVGSWEIMTEEHPVLSHRLEELGIDLSLHKFRGRLIEEWIASVSPRPILMLNGERDRIVSPDNARALFQAANEPKQIIWYDSSHVLPPQATVDCVEWIAGRLGS